MRVSINVACAKATIELMKTGELIYSAPQIQDVLTNVGRGSSSSLKQYMGRTGYLVTRGFLAPCVGGYEATSSSKIDGAITVRMGMANPFLLGEVMNELSGIEQKFGGLVTLKVEVE